LASILVTGGTGSFGKAFVKKILETDEYERIVVFSRDELKQWDFNNTLSDQEKHRVRFFLGDIRDKPRLLRAMESIDHVIHAAALKQVPAAEYNPFEFIQTNVIGTQNVIDAALDQGVTKLVSLSTDKAAAPANLYGATKLCSDRIVLAANNIKGHRDIRLSVVRYGNVMGSRGSVIPYFLSRKADLVLPITHPSMTRFNITLDHGVKVVLDAIASLKGSEIIVPKLPSYRITDLAKAISPHAALEIVGIRPGEKLHEEMITISDTQNTLEYNDKYIIYSDPSVRPDTDDGIPVPLDFSYNSLDNHRFLSVEELSSLICKYC